MVTNFEAVLLVGTYTIGGEPRNSDGRGLHVLGHDKDGRLTAVEAVPIANPSYAAYDARRGVLYSVVEQEAGAVVSVAFGRAEGWRAPIFHASTAGADPCHLAVHPDGRHLFVANYSSGSVAVFPLSADGQLAASEPSQLIVHTGSGPDAERQQAPHAHMVTVSPDGRFVLCTDLGTDRVLTYAFDAATGTLTTHSAAVLTGGAGPRHLAFHGSGRFAYLVNELSSTIVACAYDEETGELAPGPELSVRSDADPTSVNYPAAVRVSADDRFVYASNRVEDTIGVFAVESGGAALRLVEFVPCRGSWPRDIALSADGGLLFAANQRSDSITAFKVDAASGRLTAVGEPFPVASPVSVLPV